MRWITALMLLALAACGVESPPVVPEGGAGVSITGDAQIGVVGSL